MEKNCENRTVLVSFTLKVIDFYIHSDSEQRRREWASERVQGDERRRKTRKIQKLFFFSISPTIFLCVDSGTKNLYRYLTMKLIFLYSNWMNSWKNIDFIGTQLFIHFEFPPYHCLGPLFFYSMIKNFPFLSPLWKFGKFSFSMLRNFTLITIIFTENNYPTKFEQTNLHFGW